jgi:hypothetical protein
MVFDFGYCSFVFRISIFEFRIYLFSGYMAFGQTAALDSSARVHLDDVVLDGHREHVQWAAGRGADHVASYVER